MKYPKTSLLALFASIPLIMSACVENNPSVVAIAVDYRYDSEVNCSDGKYMNADLVFPEELALGGYRAGVVLENKMSTQSPYKSSGGSSGTGTTINPVIPDYNAVYINKFELRCISGACEGEKYSHAISFYLPAGGCSNPQFLVPNDWVQTAAGQSIDIGITAHYQDSGKIKNNTNEVILNLSLSPSQLCKEGEVFDFNEPSLCKKI